MNLSPYLHVFNIVLSQGEKRQSVFYFGELSAWHDFDGYTCYLGYKDLTLRLSFHSQFAYEFESKATMTEFNALIEQTILNSPSKYNQTGDDKS